MQTTQASRITDKTRELCQAILDQPEMVSARQRIQTFVADDKARAQYEDLMNKGQALQQKQQRSQQLSGEEISAFEKQREDLLSNPVARGFLEAQEEMHHVHQSINQFVSKTLELGRMPTEADFEGDDGCGHEGCGCGHSH
ncbi:MAG TPA: YlbF family regulator [Candidatus Angelobacter sp.]|nr:YlbF family regulator [Candidatus Angelobacter sp.]